jgi:hypothetical protein
LLEGVDEGTVGIFCAFAVDVLKVEAAGLDAVVVVVDVEAAALFVVDGAVVVTLQKCVYGLRLKPESHCASHFPEPSLAQYPAQLGSHAAQY